MLIVFTFSELDFPTLSNSTIGMLSYKFLGIAKMRP